MALGKIFPGATTAITDDASKMKLCAFYWARTITASTSIPMAFLEESDLESERDDEGIFVLIILVLFDIFLFNFFC